MKDQEAHSNMVKTLSTLRTKSPKRIDKQFNAQGSTNSLNRSHKIYLDRDYDY